MNISGQNLTTKGAPNAPVDFPSTIWQNGDHYNFIAQGARFTTKDKSFRTWSRVVPDMIGCHENGGQVRGASFAHTGFEQPDGQPRSREGLS